MASMLRESRLTGDNISVVIPSYNHGNYIESAVMSVIDQTVKNVEIVIVDDGSTDNSTTICKKLSRQHAQVKLFTQTNQGAHNAINYGVNLAKGEFIAVLNSDDLFERSKIEQCIDALNSNRNLEFVVGGAVLFIDEKGRIQNNGVSTEWHRRAVDFFDESGSLGLSLLNENFVVTTSNMVFSKRFWKEAAGFKSLRYCHDLEFLLEATRNTTVHVCRDNPQIRYRVHSQNTIKEDISKVRVEIASVVAQAICESGCALIGENSARNIQLFRKFLRNKNISDLVLFLIMKYLDAANNRSYYEDIFQDENKIGYSVLLD